MDNTKRVVFHSAAGGKHNVDYQFLHTDISCSYNLLAIRQLMRLSHLALCFYFRRGLTQWMATRPVRIRSHLSYRTSAPRQQWSILRHVCRFRVSVVRLPWRWCVARCGRNTSMLPRRQITTRIVGRGNKPHVRHKSRRVQAYTPGA